MSQQRPAYITGPTRAGNIRVQVAPPPLRGTGLTGCCAERSGRAAFTPGELAHLVCGFALLGDRSPEVATLCDAVAGNVVRRVKVCRPAERDRECSYSTSLQGVT